MTPTRLSVTSERGTYSVVIGTGTLDSLGSLIEDATSSRRVVVVSCAPVWRLHGATIRKSYPRLQPVLMPDGERAKTLETVARLYDAFVKRDVDRASTIVAFGGGVVGDVAGFAAATFLRGVRLVQAPTTLLAHVDSAIGGKVGVNLPSGKNLAGAWHPPALVVCDPRVLGSLPRREFRAGLYEVIKYGVIASRPLFDRVSALLTEIFGRNDDVLAALVAECCRIKADVVMLDEREAGPRRALNFGHTIGHALEAVTKYRRFRHGEAVGYGMLAAAALGAARGTFSPEDLDALRAVITRMGPLPPVADLKINDALDAITHDKKVINGRLHFVLPRGIGNTDIVSDVNTKELRGAMRTIGMKA